MPFHVDHHQHRLGARTPQVRVLAEEEARWPAFDEELAAVCEHRARLHEDLVAFGDVTVDLARRQVTRGGVELHLTPIEYRLLTLLIANAGRVLTHRQLLKEVWGPSHAEDTHYLRVYMTGLRRKLEDDPTLPRHLRTETGIGYRLVLEP